MLDFSTQLHAARTLGNYWIINHTSGYTKSASVNGNRECAASTNKAVIDYLADESHWGPTGIVMMDFAGTDRSGDYDVMGQTLVETIIDLNFRYDAKTTGIESPSVKRDDGLLYDLQGRRVDSMQQGILIRDGKKHLVK